MERTASEGGPYKSQNNSRAQPGIAVLPEMLIRGGGGALGFGDAGTWHRIWLHDYPLLALGKIDTEASASPLITRDRDGAVVVTNNGLNDGQAEAGTLMFRGVVGSK